MRVLINDPAGGDAGRDQDEVVGIALEKLRRVGKREAEVDVVIDDGVGIDRVVTSVDKDLGRRREMPDQILAPVEVAEQIAGRWLVRMKATAPAG